MAVTVHRYINVNVIRVRLLTDTEGMQNLLILDDKAVDSIPLSCPDEVMFDMFLGHKKALEQWIVLSSA